LPKKPTVYLEEANIQQIVKKVCCEYLQGSFYPVTSGSQQEAENGPVSPPLSWGYLTMSGSIFVVTAGRWMLLVSTGMRPGMLLNIMCAQDSNSTRNYVSQMSIVQRLENPAVTFLFWIVFP
jgi:hypothetical protein